MNEYPITFNPGPSFLGENIRKAMINLATGALLSQSHRGKAFQDLSEKCIKGLHEKLFIPKDYSIFYQSSATAAMDCALKNLNLASFHFVAGAFANRFYVTALENHLASDLLSSAWNTAIPWQEAKITEKQKLLVLTHCETSTGATWPIEEICKLKSHYPDKLLAIDATSSLGCSNIPWESSDIVLASVQKCLGLPSGLGLLIVSPKAMKVAEQNLTPRPAYQHFTSMQEKMRDFQTIETPNVLAIALLAKQMEEWNLSEAISAAEARARLLYGSNLKWRPYISDSKWRSKTLANFLVSDPIAWHALAKTYDMHLGSGYGKLKADCLRLACFPQIPFPAFESFIKVMRCSTLVQG